MPNDFSKIVIIALCCCSSFLPAASDGIPDSLNRGHRLILKHGLQIQALIFPDFYPPGKSFDSKKWLESKFTTSNTHESDYPLFLITKMPWARWVSWNDITGKRGPYLKSWEQPYVSSLVSLQAGDEKNIRNTNVVNYFKKTFEIWKTNYPNAINYGNFAGSTWNTDAEITNYLAIAKPDILVMDFYPFRGDVDGGSVGKWYRSLGRFRKIAMTGYDGSCKKPIPYGCYFQTYTLKTNNPLSSSELTIAQFLPLLYGYKFLVAFFYNQPPSTSMFAQLFNSSGDKEPNKNFYKVASNNFQILNIAPALERLISYGSNVWIVADKAPDYVKKWNAKIDPYITKISSSKSNVWIGYFKPINESFDGPIWSNQLYFMVLNGVVKSNASPENIIQNIRLDIDFGNSMPGLQKISRQTGKIVNLKLNHLKNSKYFIDFSLNGGEADLFKFNPKAPFVGSLDTPENIFPVNLRKVIIAPVEFFATEFKSPLGYKFKSSQWQVSNNKKFNPIIWDSGKTVPTESLIPPERAIPLGTNYWRVRYQNSLNQWSCWSTGTSFIILFVPVDN